ncbi:unnamed protein product [Ilex paraguariensis]|uniref:Uncharacterized protein n=1 Tax=Ilex paraguariensis TaxID=185542 RepID=A0ABC8RB35_9AQUA
MIPAAVYLLSNGVRWLGARFCLPDEMMHDIDTSIHASSLELPFYSMGMMHSFGNPKQKLSACERLSQLNTGHSNLKNTYGDEEIFCNSENINENLCNASSSFLDDNVLDEEYSLSWKKWSFQLDAGPSDYMNIGIDESPDLVFGHPHVENKRAGTKAGCRFNILESPAPYSKHQVSKSDHNFIITDGPWSPTVRRTFDVGDVTNQPAWSCFVTEEARESMRSLSEESCSSSAVRSEATRYPLANLVSKCSGKSIYAKETQSKKRDILQQGENMGGQGTFTSLANAPSLAPAHYSASTFQTKSGSDDGWLFEGYASGSGVQHSASSASQFSTEDTFGDYPVPKLHVDATASFEKSKHDAPAKYSPCNSFFPGKLAFSQSHKNTSFPNTRSGLSKPKLLPDFNMECISQDSFHVLGGLGEMEFPKTTVQGSVCKVGAKTSEILPTDGGKFERKDDVCNWSHSLSSEAGKAMEASDSVNNCSHSKEPEDGTPEMETLKATCSPENAEETSSSVDILDKSDGSIDEKKYRKDTQASVSCQNGCKDMEIEESGPIEGRNGSKGEKNSGDPSCQVMMLESYVLQLLCVQVLKEAFAQGIAKKV